jgi:ribosomal protein S18 acetylase RimI-like enzyme
MSLKVCEYQNVDDYWRVRAFLRQVFLLNDRLERSWHVNRLDYWRRHAIGSKGCDPFKGVMFIWETDDGQIAAVLNPEDEGQVFLQVHPELSTPGLEEEMVVTAEEYLTKRSENGQRKLWVWAHDDDEVRQDILSRRGYTKQDHPSQHHRWPLTVPLPDAPISEGYVVRALGGVEELSARSWVSWRAFHPDKPDEEYQGWEWYHSLQCAPLYRRDLDIIAVAPQGEFASFCTVWFDDVTRTGVFEPVGTAPEHQQRGLGKAVMYEGLRRLQKLGATMAYVGSESSGAKAFYNSIGFKEYDRSMPWEKVL